MLYAGLFAAHTACGFCVCVLSLSFGLYVALYTQCFH